MRALVGVMCLLVAVCVLGCPSAASGPPPNHHVVTLAETSRAIGDFAQDGDRLAWSTPDAPCRSRVHVLTLRTQTRATLGAPVLAHGIGCGELGSLAIAGSRVLWAAWDHGLSADYAQVITASLANRGARLVESVTFERDEPGLFRAAGDGSTLVFSAPAFIARVAGTPPTSRQVASADRLVSLAVSGRLLASVGQRVKPGDGCTQCVNPTWSPDGTRLAFVEGEACCSPGQIVAIHADGTGRAPVTSDDTLKRTLAWSPDGTRFAYGSGLNGIRLVSADGSGSVALTHPPAGSVDSGPRWSPDGKTIAFMRDYYSIYLIRSDGSGERRLAAGVDPSWSPDGKRIVFSTGFPSRFRVIDANGTGERQLPGAGGRGADWSHDGRRIVYSDGDIYAMNADGTHRRRLTHSGLDATPVWSPDGTKIAFASMRNELLGRNDPSTAEWDIYVMQADGTHLRPLTFTRPNALVAHTEVHDTRDGRLISTFESAGNPRAVAVSPAVVAVLARIANGSMSIRLYEPLSRASLGSVPVPAGTESELSAVGTSIVFRTGRTIRLLDSLTKRSVVLAVAATPPIGLSIEGRRIAWAEDVHDRGRIRAFVLP